MKDRFLSSGDAQTGIQVFENGQFGNLRVCIMDDQKTMFNLSDVCRALTLSTPAKVKQRLAKRGMNSIHTPTQNQYGATVLQPMTYIDEANLYRCIFQSRKAEAEKFQDWVFEEVLPQIRKTGGYIPIRNARTGEVLTTEEILARAEVIVGKTLQEANAVSTDCLTATEVAQSYGLDVKELNDLLCAMGIQYRKGGRYHLCEAYQGMGYAQDRVFFSFSLKGKPKLKTYLTWTPVGVSFLNWQITHHALPIKPQGIQLSLVFNF